MARRDVRRTMSSMFSDWRFAPLVCSAIIDTMASTVIVKEIAKGRKQEYFKGRDRERKQFQLKKVL